MPYAGLPQGTVAFLAGLEAHNNREWFQAHREAYERDFLGAGLDLVAALSGPCAALGLQAVPKTGGSLRRIFRDVRFSADKRPYEPHLHLILSTWAFNRAPGVHLLVTPGGISFGTGWYGLEPAALQGFRHGVAADPAPFLAVLADAAAVGAVLDAPELARVPKGFAAFDGDHLIRRKSVIARGGVSPHPDWVFGQDAVAGWMRLVHALAPLALWLAASPLRDLTEG